MSSLFKKKIYKILCTSEFNSKLFQVINSYVKNENFMIRMCEKLQYSACLKKDIIIRQGFVCNKGFHIILNGSVGVFYQKTNKLQYQERKNHTNQNKINLSHLKKKMIRAIHQSARFSQKKDIQLFQNLNNSYFFNYSKQKDINFSQQYINDLIRPFQKNSDFTDIIKILKILQNNYNVKDKLVNAMEQHILDDRKKLIPSTIKLLENKFGDLITQKQQGDCFGENFIDQGIRNATIISLENSEFLVLTDIKYIKIISQAFKQQTELKIEIFKKTFQLSQKDVNIKSVQDQILNFKKILFRRNQLFIKQGQKLKYLYIITKGTFLLYQQQITKENNNSKQKYSKQKDKKILLSNIGNGEVIGGEQFLGYKNSLYNVKAIQENSEVYKVPIAIFEVFTYTTITHIKKMFQRKFIFQESRQNLQVQFQNLYNEKENQNRRRIQSLIHTQQKLSTQTIQKMRYHSKFLEFFKVKNRIQNKKEHSSTPNFQELLDQEKNDIQNEQIKKKQIQEEKRRISARRFINKQRNFINIVRSQRFLSIDNQGNQKTASLKVFEKLKTKLIGKRVILRKVIKNVREDNINLKY